MLIVYNNAIILDTAAAYCMLRVFLYPNVAQYWVKVRPTTRIPKFVSLGYRETPEKIPKLVLLGYRKIPKKNTEMVSELRCYFTDRPVFEVSIHH